METIAIVTGLLRFLHHQKETRSLSVFQSKANDSLTDRCRQNKMC